MCPDLFIEKTKCALEDVLMKMFAERYPVFRVATFLNKVLYQIYFLRDV